MKKIDWTQPYGEVLGSTTGARYVQNERSYDQQGNLIVEKKEKEKKDDK